MSKKLMPGAGYYWGPFFIIIMNGRVIYISKMRAARKEKVGEREWEIWSEKCIQMNGDSGKWEGLIWVMVSEKKKPWKVYNIKKALKINKMKSLVRA